MLNKRKADDITAVLYPNDATEEGKELRLKQQFFFVSASLQDTIARYLVSSPRQSRVLESGCAAARFCARGVPSHRQSSARHSPCRVHIRLPSIGRPPPLSIVFCPACPPCLQEKHSHLSGLPDKACFQMNDTHPTIAGACMVAIRATPAPAACLALPASLPCLFHLFVPLGSPLACLIAQLISSPALPLISPPSLASPHPLLLPLPACLPACPCSG